MDIGKKIAKLRKEREMTQKELASFLNVTDKAVSRWESGAGTPEIDTVLKLAKLFNVSTDYLIDDSKTEDKPQTVPAEQPMPVQPEPPQKVVIVYPKKNLYIAGRILCGLLLVALIGLFVAFTVNLLLYCSAFEMAKSSLYPISYSSSALIVDFIINNEASIASATVSFAEHNGHTIQDHGLVFGLWRAALLMHYKLSGNALYFYQEEAPSFNPAIIFSIIMMLLSALAIPISLKGYKICTNKASKPGRW